jgi:hypothetical protein
VVTACCHWKAVHSLYAAVSFSAVYHPPASPATVTISLRIEPQLLRQVHLMAERQEMTVSATARHLLALGMDQLQPTA